MIAADLVSDLLPIVWAVVATMIGVVLYKSSQAVVESSRQSAKTKQRIRLAGSVAIAAVAFWGMFYATMQRRNDDLIASLRDVAARTKTIDRLVLQAMAATNVNDQTELRQSIEALRRENGQNTMALTKILATAGRDEP